MTTLVLFAGFGSLLVLKAEAGTPFGEFTQGGKGGKVIRVTNLDSSGKGSLRNALWEKGPRIIVFEVGGVIDLEGKSLSVKEPFVTIAGQTAPSPGITLIKGGLSIGTHDVIVQHLKVRPGEAGREKKSGWEPDGISTNAGRNIVIDHCSCTWATDENLTVSGPRFEGESPDDWRANTSHHVLFTHCLVAEALSESTHGKGEHSKGSLLHDNCSHIVIRKNVYISNKDRNPLAKGGVRATIVNNWIFNPGSKAVSHGANRREWGDHPLQDSILTIAGNLFEHGPDTQSKAPFFRSYDGPVHAYLSGNHVVPRKEGEEPLLTFGEITLLDEKPGEASRIETMPVDELKPYLAKNAGARPWDRDPIDARIIENAVEGKGAIIDSEQEVGGYPKQEPTAAPFVEAEWDLDTMERKE